MAQIKDAEGTLMNEIGIIGLFLFTCRRQKHLAPNCP